jgi:osmoprotectant transport system substrate-binding protein
VAPALRDGEIDLMVEYTGSLLDYEGGDPSPDSDATYAALVAALEPQELTALDYAPAQDKNGLVVTAETAQTLGLAAVSDLAAHNGTLVLGGPPGGPLTVAALTGGEIDVALLFTSDGVIAARGFVLLEDDMGLQPAENVVPVIRQDLIDAHGQDLVDLINRVSALITTAELSELNKRYGIDAVDADVLAREWLQANGFLG